MLSRHTRLIIITFICFTQYSGLYAAPAETDTLYLSVEQLFRQASQQHLQLAADRLKEQMADERVRTARTSHLPEINLGLRGGFLGQPIVWQNGLSNPTHPASPNWQQNYAIDFSQPLYQGAEFDIPSVRLTYSRNWHACKPPQTKPTSKWPY